MLKKIVFFFVLVFLSNPFNVLVFNHILLTKFFLIATILYLTNYSAKSYSAKFVIYVYLCIVIYFVYVYWQTPVITQMPSMLVYSFIHEMLVHFFNTAKAYVVTLRIVQNYMLINTLFFYFTLMALSFVTLFI